VQIDHAQHYLALGVINKCHANHAARKFNSYTMGYFTLMSGILAWILSPSLLDESMSCHSFSPGFGQVSLADVAFMTNWLAKPTQVHRVE
jgi:hypothetical protein